MRRVLAHLTKMTRKGRFPLRKALAPLATIAFPKFRRLLLLLPAPRDDPPTPAPPPPGKANGLPDNSGDRGVFKLSGCGCEWPSWPNSAVVNDDA